jgi:hypothetical protein
MTFKSSLYIVICTTTLITFETYLTLVVFYSYKKACNNNDNNKNDLDMETVVYILVQAGLRLPEPSQAGLNQARLVSWPRSKIALE